MNTKDAQVDEGSQCTHCGRKFLRSSTLQKHTCEQKRRWLDRERPANRIGYGAWRNFYETHHRGKRNLEYSDFASNSYYTAFVKFGSYCVDVSAINPTAYSIWLVKNRVPVDNWASDRSYTGYLIEYLRVEDPHEAVKRTVSNLLDIAQEQNIHLADVFRYTNTNRLTSLVIAGRISPWVIYHSTGGLEWLTGLDSGASGLILDYIDPEKWKIKFIKIPETVAEIKAILRKIPL